MSFIKIQGLKKNENGVITRGTASWLGTEYDSKISGHSRHTVIEKLGRVLKLRDDHRQGIFESPTRGIVSFNADTEEFAPVTEADLKDIPKAVLPCPQEHVVFGDAYLLGTFLRSTGMLETLRGAFESESDYERMVIHLFHSLLSEGAHTRCDVFFRQSVLSWGLEEISAVTLRSDTQYFSRMGWDDTKLAVFRAIVAWMRKVDPEFGQACYIDSSPLPNDVSDNPYNKLRCKGSKDCAVQMRLALVLDQRSGVPVWFEVLPGNLMDMNTLHTTTEDVRASLGITITDLVLDSGYVSRELLEKFRIGAPCTMIARMPDRRGYPYRALYRRVKSQIGGARYDFERKGHVYFGRRFEEKIHGSEIYAYVLVDKNNALEGYAKFRGDHSAQFEAMTLAQRNWRAVESGYFILLSNRKEEPENMLWEYISRADIEAIFKDDKTFMRLLPLAKWTDLTVRGKILSDIVAEIIRVWLLRSLPKYTGALHDLFDETRSIRCFQSGDGRMHIGTPNKQSRGVYKLFSEHVPAVLEVSQWKSLLTQF